MIRITCSFSFEAAHAIYNYPGACRNIHGHRYEMHITVSRSAAYQYAPEQEMVIDFKDLKKIVNENALDEMDHALMLSEQNDFARDTYEGKLLLLPYEPTVENLLVWIAARLQKALPANVLLHSIRLHETGKNYAEWTV